MNSRPLAMSRPLLLALLVGALAGDARAQTAPRAVLEAENYVITVQYRQTPPPTSRQLHEAYVTVTPVDRRAKALWDGSLRALRLYPAHAAASKDGEVWLAETDGGHYYGFGMVPAPGAMRAASFADPRDVSAAYDLNPNDYSDPDDGDDSKEPSPDCPGPGDTEPDKPSDPDDPDDDLVDPWEDDVPTPGPSGPAPEWPDNMGDDLENPWPGRTQAQGNCFYLAY